MGRRYLGRVAIAVALALAVALAVVLPPAQARACGLFASSAASEADVARRLPYLAIERVFVVWDPATETEDFIREARFEQADRRFGFVVPVPSRPEVFAVEQPPFDALARAFPFHSGQIGSGRGLGSMSSEPAPVEVVSRQRIGRFTAFVLAAGDGGGLEGWLRDNGFDAPESARPWLDHYVRLGFWYVALRYDAAAPGAADRRMTSETVRIRFKSAVPYYPYLEPARSDEPRSRLLEVWYASTEPAAPVASRARPDGSVEWFRPWDGDVATPRDLRGALGSLGAILPEAGLTVEAFRDAKTSRAGWGDVLIVPARLEQPLARPVTDITVSEQWPLLPVLDPRLEAHVHDTPPAASVVFPPAPAASVPPLLTERDPGADSCDVAAAGGAGDPGLAAGACVIAAVLVLARGASRTGDAGDAGADR